MRNITLLLTAFLLYSAGCQQSDFSQFKQSMISSGNNYPDFNFGQNHMDRLIVSLHNKTPKDDFIKKYSLSSDDYNKSVDFLIRKGFVKKAGDQFVPTCMIISKTDGEELFKKAAPFSEQIADSVISFLPYVKEKYLTTDLSKKLPFDSVSFFILSDVLLDNWQINNVESLYIKTERPLRHGKNYYYAFLESSDENTGPFGIYGNMGFNNFSVYGRNQSKVNSNKISQNQGSLPFIDNNDNRILDELADRFKGQLLSVLVKNNNYAIEVYKKSGYSKEVDFSEFFIWWYHFIYTGATNTLSAKKLISIPANGNFLYRIE
jgi:hypothetical protein